MVAGFSRAQGGNFDLQVSKCGKTGAAQDVSRHAEPLRVVLLTFQALDAMYGEGNTFVYGLGPDRKFTRESFLQVVAPEGAVLDPVLIVATLEAGQSSTSPLDANHVYILHTVDLGDPEGYVKSITSADYDSEVAWVYGLDDDDTEWFKIPITQLLQDMDELTISVFDRRPPPLMWSQPSSQAVELPSSSVSSSSSSASSASSSEPSSSSSEEPSASSASSLPPSSAAPQSQSALEPSAAPSSAGRSLTRRSPPQRDAASQSAAERRARLWQAFRRAPGQCPSESSSSERGNVPFPGQADPKRPPLPCPSAPRPAPAPRPRQLKPPVVVSPQAKVPSLLPHRAAEVAAVPAVVLLAVVLPAVVLPAVVPVAAAQLAVVLPVAEEVADPGSAVLAASSAAGLATSSAAGSVASSEEMKATVGRRLNPGPALAAVVSSCLSWRTTTPAQARSPRRLRWPPVHHPLMLSRPRPPKSRSLLQVQLVTGRSLRPARRRPLPPSPTRAPVLPQPPSPLWLRLLLSPRLRPTLRPSQPLLQPPSLRPRRLCP